MNVIIVAPQVVAESGTVHEPMESDIAIEEAEIETPQDGEPVAIHEVPDLEYNDESDTEAFSYEVCLITHTCTHIHSIAL